MSKKSDLYLHLKEKEEEEKSKQKDNKLKKYQWFELILYPQDNETNHNNDILEFVKNNKYLYKKCIYIVHDRDIDENGQVKKSHVHLIFKSYEKYTVAGIIKQFVYLNEMQVIGIEHIRIAISYLTHDTFEAEAQGKVKYNKEELQGDVDFIQEIVQNRYYAQNILLELIAECPFTIDVYERFGEYSKKTQILLKQEFESRPAFYQNICREEQIKRRFRSKFPQTWEYIDSEEAKIFFNNRINRSEM